MKQSRAASVRQKEARGKTLVVGLGITGFSCARYLAAQGVAVAITDSRPNPPCLLQLREELPDLAVFPGGFREEVFKAADRIILSPGISLQESLVQAALARSIPVYGDIELFAQAAQVPVVAITGSNGKSTVTTLVGEMARRAGIKVAVGGNLGHPALDLLATRADLYVLELSSFQLETTFSLKPKAAVVLNLSPDHMDRYPHLTAYSAAKARVYHNAEVAVVNRDDPSVLAMVDDFPSTIVGFSFGPPQGEDYGIVSWQGEDWICQGGEPLVPVTAIALAGTHNLANALAALALADACDIPRAASLAALIEFRGLAHRCQLVATKRGVRWYNDSKGTNVGATIAALEGLHPRNGRGKTVLIAGGDGKGADFSSLAEVVERTARAVVLIGRDAPLIAEALAERVKLIYAGLSMVEAVRLAAILAEPGDRVLLSPACASFDMFRNFEHRGDVFVSAVESLPE